MPVAGRSEMDLGARNTTQQSPRLKQEAPAQTEMGSGAIGYPMMNQAKGLGRSPSRRSIPRGFAINRATKFKMGSGRQRKLVYKKATAVRNLPDAMAGALPQEKPSYRMGSEPKLNGDKSALVHEKSRLRRLILEEDHDDDMVDVVVPAMHATCQQPMQRTPIS
ncbi:unnamed protein product [Linum trigynum]|uniref:Uncharacterized protein n=1 Tax=Linum trigynum TaxID=586398 RepID=A0AAV2CE08_9ROSI